MADTRAVARELGAAVDKLLAAADHVQRCAIAAINGLPSAPQEPDDGETVKLVDRIKQMKTERKRYFDVEGDGVDELLNDLWDFIDRLQAKAPETD